jgi:hypothetical protein
VVNWIVREKPVLKEKESNIVKKFEDEYIIGPILLKHDGGLTFFKMACVYLT